MSGIKSSCFHTWARFDKEIYKFVAETRGSTGKVSIERIPIEMGSALGLVSLVCKKILACGNKYTTLNALYGD